MLKRKLLLLDDSEISLELEAVSLEARGYEVRTATTLAAFDDALKAFQPDMILTDFHMPEITGDNICKTLKSHYDTRDIPIVIFSSLSDDELSKIATRVGADGYLSKTHGIDALGEKVDALVDSICW